MISLKKFVGIAITFFFPLTLFLSISFAEKPPLQKEYYLRAAPNNPAAPPPKGSYYEYDELGRIKRIIRRK